jgi:hypothetical protein
MLRRHCTHWFASNYMPKTTDTSDGLQARVKNIVGEMCAGGWDQADVKISI